VPRNFWLSGGAQTNSYSLTVYTPKNKATDLVRTACHSKILFPRSEMCCVGWVSPLSLLKSRTSTKCDRLHQQWPKGFPNSYLSSPATCYSPSWWIQKKLFHPSQEKRKYFRNSKHSSPSF
jgi:hypothetical protein